MIYNHLVLTLKIQMELPQKMDSSWSGMEWNWHINILHKDHLPTPFLPFSYDLEL